MRIIVNAAHCFKDSHLADRLFASKRTIGKETAGRIRGDGRVWSEVKVNCCAASLSRRQELYCHSNDRRHQQVEIGNARTV